MVDREAGIGAALRLDRAGSSGAERISYREASAL
jgi:hypothetical protein